MSTREVGDYLVFLHGGSVLGRGGQAYVRKAIDTRTHRTVAAKEVCFNDQVRQSNYYTKHLLPELKVWEKLKHEYLVEFLCSEYIEDYIYLMFEYCEFGSLSDFVSGNILSDQ